MVIGALALLLALGFADEDRYLLMPSFLHNPRVGVLPKGEADQDGIHGAISLFNRQLSLAYRGLDAAALMSFPIDDGLRRSYIEELEFLRKRGTAMDITVTDLQIQEVTRLPNELVSVKTAEAVALRYLRLADRTEIESYPRTAYVMNYLLEPSGSGWKVVRTETLKVQKLRD